MSYSPLKPPSFPPSTDAGVIVRYLDSELVRVGAETELPKVSGVVFSELNVEPKKRFTGLVVMADGVNWDPGMGKGFYGYYGGAWHFLG